MQRRNALKGVRVLVTDDEESARDLMSQVLTSEGADVMTAADGDEAARICGKWKPALVILDIGMPAADGYEVLRRLRETAERPFVAVAVTGFARDADRARARAAGFAAYVTKPYDVDHVIALIANLSSAQTV
jgi:CheY-like chemotaxis protein